ncbi:MAG: COP23 domain-containing protein [Pseudanabaenaceae cyanobacterium SKYGB_i_bin29]|nr:COP23 domain-containing protein [Pseudanabaenaceae cyanobacterium SKYG29]MDW8421773.1 COP23 domain-containing protein [Pseudanabaenaceae cyanobacterium SKYGB_i_bin29]
MQYALILALTVMGGSAMAQEVIPIEPPLPNSVPPVTIPTPPPEPATTGTTTGERFICELRNGQLVVSYRPESDPNRSFPWAAPRTLGGGWSAERRCQEIARRLESYRPDGLDELRIGRENGYNTVCATTDRVPTCRIVFTVPPGQDPLLTRDRVFANLVSAEQGQVTAPVNTFAHQSFRFGDLWRLRQPGIKLKPFLAPADGGTRTNF